MFSGVPRGTVLGLLLFFTMISDIEKDVSEYKLVSFADDTRLYPGVGDVTDCDNLQFDWNDWTSSNNMFFFTTKGLITFVLSPTCLPISQICILTLR